MVDINKQIHYWREGAREDWEVGVHLVETGRRRYGLFFAHLTLEKILKALVCKQSQDLAPRIHNLVRLSELTDIGLNNTQIDILSKMNAFQIEGRYPEFQTPPPDATETSHYMKQAEEMYKWLKSQL